MTAARVISADSHVQEPPELYEERLPQRFRHRAPRLEVRDDGATYRIVDGKRPRRLDLAAAEADEEDQQREFRNDPSGGRDIERRLADQARDGVCAEVIYPNQSLFLYNSPAADYQLALARAYNDWCHELFGAHRDRFAPVGIVPVADIGAAVTEVERLAALGYVSVKVPITIKTLPYNMPAYEPLWAALAASGMVVAFHAFTNAEDQYPEDWGEEQGVGGALHFMAQSMIDGMDPLTRLISGGVLMRHPDLRFVVVECGAGWLSWLLYLLDEQYAKKHMFIRPRLDLKPSEYFARQGAVTFSEDPAALRTLDMTGSGCLLWGSDYPHDEGTFPHSQAVIERTFAGVPEADRRAIVFDNAQRLYRFAV